MRFEPKRREGAFNQQRCTSFDERGLLLRCCKLLSDICQIFNKCCLNITVNSTWNPALLEYWLRHFRYDGKGPGKVTPEAFGASETPCVVVRSAAVSQTVLEKTKPDATCGRA